MKLYELSAEYKAFYDAVEDFEEEPDAWFDTLESIEADFKDKAANVACYIKSLRAEEAAIKEECKKLTERARAKANAADRLAEYLKGGMIHADIKKIDHDPRVAVTIKATPESVRIEDENAFRSWCMKHHDDLLRYKEPEINKTAVKEAVKNGEKFDGVTLEKGKTIVIK